MQTLYSSAPGAIRCILEGERDCNDLIIMNTVAFAPRKLIRKLAQQLLRNDLLKSTKPIPLSSISAFIMGVNY